MAGWPTLLISAGYAVEDLEFRSLIFFMFLASPVHDEVY